MSTVRTIKMHGELKKFGNQFRFAGNNLPQILDAMYAMRPGLKQEIEKGNWNIVVNNKDFRVLDITKQLDDDELEIHILPYLEGSGLDDIFKIIGVILIAVAMFYSGGTVAGLATMVGSTGLTAGTVLLAGISMFWSGYQMSRMDNLSQQQSERQSYMFNGPVNTQVQGGPVPIVYGRFRAGSTVINAGAVIARESSNPGYSGGTQPGSGGNIIMK